MLWVAEVLEGITLMKVAKVDFEASSQCVHFEEYPTCSKEEEV